MLTVNVKSNMADIAADFAKETDDIRRNASRALNTAIRGVRTDGGRELRKRYPKLKLKDVNDLINLRFSSPAILQAELNAKGRPLSLMRFQVGETKKIGGGVTVTVKGQRKFIPHAWVQTLKNNRGDDYQVIMIRDVRRGGKVKVLKTINIPDALSIEEVQKVLIDAGEGRFDAEFIRLMERK